MLPRSEHEFDNFLSLSAGIHEYGKIFHERGKINPSVSKDKSRTANRTEGFFSGNPEFFHEISVLVIFTEFEKFPYVAQRDFTQWSK